MWGTIFKFCILPLLITATGYLVAYLKAKKEELQTGIKNQTYNKYLDMLENTISNCVLSTTQTYVDNLKKQNKFDIEAQKTAFNMTFQKVKSSLTEEGEEYLKEIISDLDTYISNRIEAEVITNKMGQCL